MNKKNKQIDFLSNEVFSHLKGYLALCILLHHIYQFSSDMFPTKLKFLFLNLGYWSVACFIFMSGYGLMISYINKGDSYLTSFPKKRLLSFAITYVISAFFYISYDCIIGTKHTIKEYITTFSFGGTIISFGWYLQITFLLYLVFWLVFRFIKNGYLRSGLLFLFSLSFILIYYFIGMPESNSTPTVVFLFGILLAVHKDFFEKLIAKYSVLIFAVSFAFFILGYYIIWHFNPVEIYVIILRVISGIALILCVLTLLSWITKLCKGIIINPVSGFLGKISLEMYILQGIVLRTLYKCFGNGYSFVLLSILITIPLAVLYEILIRKIRVLTNS